MIWLGLAALVGLGAHTETSAALGVTPFADGRDPPPYRVLDPAQSAQVSLGRSVFNTVWAPARTPDENAAGARVPSRWRTAPLWGLGYRMTTEAHPTFLHDGRARSPEEAILWHSGEAAAARRNFMNLWGRPRETLLHWLETL